MDRPCLTTNRVLHIALPSVIGQILFVGEETTRTGDALGPSSVLGEDWSQGDWAKGDWSKGGGWTGEERPKEDWTRKEEFKTGVSPLCQYV